MKIWIDADACPRVIKDMVYRASERLKIPVCLVANSDLSKAHTHLVSSVRVKDGFDVVTTTTHKMLRGPRGAMIMAKPEFGEKIDKAIFPGFQGGPHEHAIAAMAVCFKEALLPDYKKYCQQIVKNAQALADALPIVHARFQDIEPAPAGISYNFIRWWVPKALQKPSLAP